MYTTIQITADDDKEIRWLKKQLGLSSKRAVLLAGLESLRALLQQRVRSVRLKTASLRVRSGSRASNREWAPHSSALEDA